MHQAGVAKIVQTISRTDVNTEREPHRPTLLAFFLPPFLEGLACNLNSRTSPVRLTRLYLKGRTPRYFHENGKCTKKPGSLTRSHSKMLSQIPRVEYVAHVQNSLLFFTQ